MSEVPDGPGFDEFVQALSRQSLPPVDRWRPTLVRDMDLRIDAAGEWFYEGTSFGRRDLVRLLSTVMVREGDEYFLVSPAEKLRISVEDVPFVATDFEVAGQGADQRIVFDTNVDYKVPLDDEHPLRSRPNAEHRADIPYLVVRDGLEARLARGVFYRLVELGEERESGTGREFGVTSHGRFFPLGAVTW